MWGKVRWGEVSLPTHCITFNTIIPSPDTPVLTHSVLSQPGKNGPVTPMITDNNQGQFSIKNKPDCLGYFESTRKLGRETFLRCYRWNKICFKFTDDLDRSRDRDKSDATVLTNIITFYFCPNPLEPVWLCLWRYLKKIWSPDQTVWCLTVITIQYDGRQIKYKCWK